MSNIGMLLNGSVASSEVLDRNNSQGFTLKSDCLSKWMVMTSLHNIVVLFFGVICYTFFLPRVIIRIDLSYHLSTRISII